MTHDTLLSQIGLLRWRLQNLGLFPRKLQVEGKKETTRLALMLLGPRSEAISGLSLILVLSLFKKVFPLALRSTLSAETIISKFPYDHRLQTVRIFAYSTTRKQSNKRSGARLKTESETGERPRESGALRACEILKLR